MTNHGDVVSPTSPRVTWESAGSMGFAASSPSIAAKSKPTFEEEDRSIHPRRSSNRDLVRDYRRGSLDESNPVRGVGHRPSVSLSSSSCGLEDSFCSLSTNSSRSHRGSISSNFEDVYVPTRQRGSVSSETGDIQRQTSDGNRSWCNFCFETGHTGNDCPWHPKIPVNDSQLAVSWHDGRSRKSVESTEWTTEVDFGEEKNWFQDATEDPLEGEHGVQQSPQSQYLEQTRDSSNYSHGRWGSNSTSYRTLSRESTPSAHDGWWDPSCEDDNTGGGWISVDPSKNAPTAYCDDALARLQSESNGLYGLTEDGVDFRSLASGDRNLFFNEESYHSARGPDEFDQPDYLESRDGSLSPDRDPSFKSFDSHDSDTSVGSTRSADGRRRRTGGSRSVDASVPGHTRVNSATVTIIAPSVITFMHPRVPAKAVANSPIKTKPRLEHRRSASQGFGSTYPAQDYNDQRSAAMRAGYGDMMGHRMEPVIMEPPKKQSVDETVGVVPPVIGKRCHKCWGYGHLHAQCPSRNGGANAKNSRDGSWKQCRYCRERGHVFSDCPHLQPNQAGGFSSPSLTASPVPRIIPSSPKPTRP